LNVFILAKQLFIKKFMRIILFVFFFALILYLRAT